MTAPRYQALGYALATMLLMALTGGYAASEHWLGDFWEHAAVVKELSRSPFAPEHHLLIADAPVYFFSPYHWMLGWLSNVTGIDSLRLLQLAAVGNTLLLSIGVWMACRALHPDPPSRVGIYALLLMMFGWGEAPWFWSGFAHVDVIGYVAAYPSTAVLGGSLVAIGLADALRTRWSWWRFGWLAGLLGFGLLAQSVVALLGVAAVATFAAQPSAGRRRWGLLSTIPISLGLAMAWPLYPFIELFTGATEMFHEQSRILYEDVWSRTYPILLGAPVALWRLRGRATDPLAWMLIAMAGLYLAGQATGKLGAGRAVSMVAVLVQLGLAGTIVRLEGRGGRSRLIYAALVLATVGFAVPHVSSVSRAWQAADPRPTETYSILRPHVGPRDVVLSDIEFGFPIPSFAGKIVAADRFVFWVDDYQERYYDVVRFFHPATPTPERQRILRRHQVDFVLARANQGVGGLGNRLASQNGVVLFRVTD